ncbi:hypothetical protein ACFMQL_04380 [Nonomuraea fastidiosa]|jgi:putative hydrolase of the HAD superfamily|uniref:hypothetical protein n=1 Tax=Nonomuraea TaxID=83681 RepID=UPI00324D5C4C
MPLALFDLDNTLIDRHAAFERWAAEFAAQRRLGAEAVPWLVTCPAEVLDGLARLRAAGWTLGIVTNGSTTGSCPARTRPTTPSPTCSPPPS